jgi:outer membrane autotransporter protein
VDYSAFSLGVYTTYLQGGFFIDATFKADFGTMDYDSNVGGGFSDDDSASFTSVGGVIDTGYRFGLGTSAFFEPQASLSYVHTSIDDISVLGTDVSFDDGESLLGRLGARLGASMDGNTMRSEFFVQASVYDEFMGDYDASLASNGFDPSTSFDASGVYGEVGVGANVFGIGSSWNGFVTGNVQFGDDEYLGYNGNVGMRYSW